ncbi:MAG: tetratricopeptide repeat protein [Formivibrio sp.]|nr:tetratricopeptide repeat protein [Formivibrio sp.]
MAEIRPYSFKTPRPELESVQPSISSDKTIAFSTLRFLVVDSVPNMRAATCAQLGNFGAGKVDYASQAGDALNLIRGADYDVILSEYDLGNGFDGLYLFEEARRHGLLKASCVFMMVTAERRATRVIGAAELAPDAIVFKPYTGEMLYSKLLRAIRQKSRFRPIDEAILARDFLRAIHLCSTGIEIGDEDAPAFLRMKVHLLLRVGSWEEARDLCRETLAMADLAWARMALGKALYHLNGFDEARTVFQGVIAEHELVMEAYDWLARTQNACDDKVGALETLKNASARSPYVVGRQRDLGDLAWRQGDLATAESAMAETVRLARYSFGRDPADLGRLAEIQMARGDLANARRSTEEIRKEFRESPAAALADALDADIWLRLGEKQKAREALNQSLQRLARLPGPPPAEIGLLVANACMRQQQFDSGEKIAQTVLKNRHDDQSLRARVTDVFRSAGREERGQQLIEETAHQIASLNNDAVRLARAGDLAAAAEQFMKAVEDIPANALVLVNAANALLAFVNRHGWHDAYMRHAAEYLERSMNIDPDDGRTLQLAELYRRTCLRYGKS